MGIEIGIRAGMRNAWLRRGMLHILHKDGKRSVLERQADTSSSVPKSPSNRKASWTSCTSMICFGRG